MQRRRLGQLEVSAVGLGCGTMTPFYGEPDRAAGSRRSGGRARSASIFSTPPTAMDAAATRSS